MSAVLHSYARSAAAILLPLGAFAWSAPGLAVSGCLPGAAPNKLCLDFSSIPGDSVQPSQLAGTPTYVKYKGKLSNTSLATSRFVTLTFDLVPASGFVSVEAEDMACSINGSRVSCLVDKLERIDPLDFTLVAEAPLHPTTATQLTNTAVFGNNGNTATIVHTIGVSTTAGRSYVPAGEEVTVVSSPETDPAHQVSPEDPLWAKATLPPQPVDYYAEIEIITEGPRMANCVNGLYVSVFDGGPYLCRDALSPRRWASFNVGETEGALEPMYFTAANPMAFTMIWDASIVPAEQQPPNELFTTGVPQFAVFYAQPENNPYPDSVNARAFADTCGTLAAAPPCLETVERFGTGDWRAVGLKQTDQSDLATPIDDLFSMLDFLLGTADAKGILPPIMG